MTLRRYRNFVASSVLGLALFAVGLPLLTADIITANIYILGEDEVEEGDVYLASTSARVEGTVEGDFVVSTGRLSISGTVTGDVLVMSQGTVRVTGEIQGSLRGAAREVIVEGTVGHDVAVLAVATRIEGSVARDALVFGGSLTVDGSVGGDINGRMVTANVDGPVGNDLDVAVGRLTLGPNADIGGDVLYRSGSDADVAAMAQVAGQLDRLPTRGSFSVELVLTIATIIGFFGFLFAGVVLLWLFRATGPRAVVAVESQLLRSLGIGLAAMILVPLLIVLLIATLVGVPVAIALAVLLILGLLFGPVPAVTALGSRLLRRQQLGLFAAFLVGAIIWRAGIWLIPYVGVVLYLVALIAGVGGWLIAIWERRKETPVSADLLPRRVTPVGAANIPEPVDWDAPLAPGTVDSPGEEEPPVEPETGDQQ
ncbi:MAG: hypothetical protein QNJ89_13210 [Acidimicrobiia bacterium]|nr:hypothetical protein [Acidimicrobiia bacterium]